MKNCTLVAVVGLAFAGGMFSERWFAARPVLASAAPAIIEAQSFRLKDSDGRTLGEMLIEPNGKPALKFYDLRGRTIWEAPAPMAYLATSH